MIQIIKKVYFVLITLVKSSFCVTLFSITNDLDVMKLAVSLSSGNVRTTDIAVVKRIVNKLNTNTIF